MNDRRPQTDGHVTDTATEIAVQLKPLLVASAERSNPKQTQINLASLSDLLVIINLKDHFPPFTDLRQLHSVVF